tara:strand:- start:115 stop:945 length:831 start_codon:yes stop_codon:yes gene_type:complete
MPSKTGKPYSSFYKNDLSIDKSTNTGCDTTVRAIQSGDGTDTSLKISTRACEVRPVSDIATTFSVKKTNGNSILNVDGVYSTVKIGASQTYANTQYVHFGIGHVDPIWAGALDDTHYAIPFASHSSTSIGTIADLAMGSATDSSFGDTDPADSLTITDSAMHIVSCYWYVIDDITVDGVVMLNGANAAAGDVVFANLMAYTVDTANGSTGGDLSDGVVVAQGGFTNAGYEQIYYKSLSLTGNVDIDAGKVVLFTFAFDNVEATDHSLSVTVKYHVR